MSKGKTIPLDRPVWTLNLPHKLITKLRSNGFETCQDVFHESSKQEIEALVNDGQLLNDISNYSMVQPESTTLSQLYEKENEKEGISTFCKDFDSLFGVVMGIPLGQITELVGPPASGKTQICLQLCVSVQIPSFLGGVSGAAVYIDTNCNYSDKRLHEIYTSCMEHCSEICSCDGECLKLNRSLDRWLCRYTVTDVAELQGCVHYIERRLRRDERNENEREIKLVIVDGIGFLLNNTIESSLERTGVASRLLSHFRRLASLYDAAIVLTNNLTSTFSADGFIRLTPSLGETFSHNVHNRIMLQRHSNKIPLYYTAILEKSSSYPDKSANFQIITGGIRDIAR